jgi:hypothetical protein
MNIDFEGAGNTATTGLVEVGGAPTPIPIKALVKNRIPCILDCQASVELPKVIGTVFVRNYDDCNLEILFGGKDSKTCG